MFEILIAGLLGLAVFLIVYSMFNMYRETYRYVDVHTADQKPPILLRMALPFAKMVGVWIAETQGGSQGKGGGFGFIDSLKRRLDKMIISSGTPFNLTSYHLMGLSIISFITSFVLFFGLLLLAQVNIQYVLSISIFASIILFFLPYLWLKDILTKRQLIIRKTLPYTLDLLTLSVEAGLDFTSALGEIVSKIGENNPLCYELNQALREISMGKSRSQALRDTSERIDLPEMQSVSGAIIQADELGASLGPVIRILAEQIRTKRFQRAEKLALEAPVKMLFPLVAFIFPTTFLVIFGPIIIKYILMR